MVVFGEVSQNDGPRTQVVHLFEAVDLETKPIISQVLDVDLTIKVEVIESDAKGHLAPVAHAVAGCVSEQLSCHGNFSLLIADCRQIACCGWRCYFVRS